jgi:hypothetical protein
MMRVACIGLSSVLIAATLAAQNNASKPSAGPATNLMGSSTCPVRMHALQGSGFGLVKVRGEQHLNSPGQRIHLILANPKSMKVAGAKVTIHGLSPKSRVARALSNSEGPSDLTKSVEVTFTSEDETSVFADLVLPGFSSITSIELQSIRYQDGTIWSVAGLQACQVVPDPLMLIAGR